MKGVQINKIFIILLLFSLVLMGCGGYVNKDVSIVDANPPFAFYSYRTFEDIKLNPELASLYLSGIFTRKPAIVDNVVLLVGSVHLASEAKVSVKDIGGYVEYTMATVVYELEAWDVEDVSHPKLLWKKDVISTGEKRMLFEAMISPMVLSDGKYFYIAWIQLPKQRNENGLIIPYLKLLKLSQDGNTLWDMSYPLEDMNASAESGDGSLFIVDSVFDKNGHLLVSVSDTGVFVIDTTSGKVVSEMTTFSLLKEPLVLKQEIWRYIEMRKDTEDLTSTNTLAAPLSLSGLLAPFVGRMFIHIRNNNLIGVSEGGVFVASYPSLKVQRIIPWASFWSFSRQKDRLENLCLESGLYEEMKLYKLIDVKFTQKGIWILSQGHPWANRTMNTYFMGDVSKLILIFLDWKRGKMVYRVFSPSLFRGRLIQNKEELFLYLSTPYTTNKAWEPYCEAFIPGLWTRYEGLFKIGLSSEGDFIEITDRYQVIPTMEELREIMKGNYNVGPIGHMMIGNTKTQQYRRVEDPVYVDNKVMVIPTTYNALLVVDRDKGILKTINIFWPSTELDMVQRRAAYSKVEYLFDLNTRKTIAIDYSSDNYDNLPTKSVVPYRGIAVAPWTSVWWASTSTYEMVNPLKVGDAEAYAVPWRLSSAYYDGRGSFYGEIILYDRKKDVGIYLALPMINDERGFDRYAIVFFSPSDLESHTIKHPLLGNPVSDAKWHHLSNVESKFEGVNVWHDSYFEVSNSKGITLMETLRDNLGDVIFYPMKDNVMWLEIPCKDGKGICNYVLWNKRTYKQRNPNNERTNP